MGKSKVLLIDENTLKSYTLISEQVDGKYLLPSIEMAQNIDLETLIGGALLKKICDLVYSGEIWNEENDAYHTLLDDYITPYLCWDIMAAVQPSINYKMSNSGVYGNDDSNKSRMDYKNSQLLQEQYMRNANAFATKMKNYLLSHINEYPEYVKCLDYETAEEVNTCGIYLGDVRLNKHNYWYK